MRNFVAALAAALAVAAASVTAGCSSPAAKTSPACAPGNPGTGTVDGWLGYLGAHRADWGAVIDDGSGGTLRHAADSPLPTASALKLIHLAAYAREVATGRLDPARRIPLADWQRWYLPTDGGAHVKALQYLHIPAKGGVPTDPARHTVTVDQLADVMIRFSDSAAPDALRAVMGDGPLRQVMDDNGIGGPVPSLVGLYRSITESGARTDAQVVAAADRTYALSPAQLFRLMRSLASGSFGAGSDVARRLLEYQPAPPGLTGFGFKGGSLPGILTEVFEARRTDGSVAVGVLMVHRAAPSDLQRDVAAGMPHQKLLLQAMLESGMRNRMACAAGN
ncbi:serine hydrolase [Tsukamurella sp. 8F]|uniref:serine hydrolase n=1 Tax=unclassified Tsukamurella TaxID=2633480 RepID=UPI0023B892D6|nr:MULTISPECIES: serine hydrolase [unclassified Tsukamurella]MDF0528347.1 serine hydrolase [Tsukamurella sp. 8J]MDF0586172.1 serine hydrolase [Tsukamurella sp. 8F]